MIKKEKVKTTKVIEHYFCDICEQSLEGSYRKLLDFEKDDDADLEEYHFCEECFLKMKRHMECLHYLETRTSKASCLND